ncbi:MAG: hypothetical protein Q9201_000638 [Fulgogasparrea decipioides]
MAGLSQRRPLQGFHYRSRVPQAALIPRLTVQFSCLSLADRHSNAGTVWSLLESVPPEVFTCISEHLAFFDKKALASTSRRVYDLMGHLVTPDRFAWRVHVVTSFNRAPDAYFDVTIFKAQQLRREIRRLVKQTPTAVTRGHFVSDPTTTRLKDLSCIYFPAGFQTQCGGKRVLCYTLGQFIAIQFVDYVSRVVQTSKRGESKALDRRYVIPGLEFTDEQKQNLTKEAKKWREIHDEWLQGSSSASTANNDDKDRETRLFALSVWDYSSIFASRMGIEVMQGHFVISGRICEVGEHQGFEVRRQPSPLLASLEENSDWNEDDDLRYSDLEDDDEDIEAQEQADSDDAEDDDG